MRLNDLIESFEKRFSSAIGKPIDIRLIAPSQIPDLLKLEERCFKDAYAFGEDDFEDIFMDITHLGFSVYCDNSPIAYILGYALTIPNEGNAFYLASLAVSPEYQRKRLGTSLLDIFKIMVSENGYAKIHLHTPDLPENRNYYLSQGFKFIYTEYGYYETDTDVPDAAMMCFNLK